MTTHSVLITGIGGNIGQGILKSLRAGKRSYYIVGIDMEPLSAGFSLVDSYYKTPRTGDPAFMCELERIARKEKLEAIYVCSPAELEFFSRHKKKLEQELDLAVLVNSLNVVYIGSDKLKTANFLCEAGMPYPETVLATDEDGLNQMIVKYGFPLFVKPAQGFTSKNVFMVHSREEVIAVRTLVPDLIVQRYLPDTTNEYTATTISGHDKEVVASIVLHRDLNQGTTYRTELVQDDNLTDQIIRVVKALGSIGVCNLQFRLLDGKAFVFEINPRFSGTCGIRYLYGFNDSEMVFEHFRLGLDICQPKLQPAVVLRYWNEIFIPGVTFQKLREGDRHRGIQTLIHNPSDKEYSQTQSISDKGQDKTLDSMAEEYFTQKALGPDSKQKEFIIKAVMPHCSGPKVLELGYGNGHWTRKLVDMGFEVTVVEGSSSLVKHCRNTFGKSVKIVQSLFEEFEPTESYQTIIASCVLEHVEDPKKFLSLLRSWLDNRGKLNIIVPNALSLHRRVGLKMGMLSNPLQLSPQELEVGHRHAYTTEIFKAQLEESHLQINFIKGVFLKPLSSGQMMDWADDLLEGYNELSEELSEYTAFLYANCFKK